MSDAVIRIAIAEVCGWKPHPTEKCVYLAPKESKKNWALVIDLPDYPNDLNAMHEAENHLTPRQQSDYYERVLKEVVGYGGFSITFQNIRTVVHATARQRAEAFLRTIGKWKK